MNIRFSVNSAKIEKRKADKGEDAPVVNKQGIMIVCDGMGATGMTEHTIRGKTYTSAYIGSRATSRAAERFLTENYDRVTDSFGNAEKIEKIVADLGKSIRKELTECIKKDNLVLTVHGKSFRLLPTTFTAVVYKLYETKVEVVVMCAGDSGAFWWNSDGLHQLSAEYTEGGIFPSGECKVSNCISADDDFRICFSFYELNPKGIFLATTDGFTDPIKTFEQEGYLIEWLGGSDYISEEKAGLLSAEISNRLDDIGFTKRDDCSMAGVIIGYSSDEELKSDFRNRYKSELVEGYIKPYMELNRQYAEIEKEMYEVRQKLYGNKDNIVLFIAQEILEYLDCCKDRDTPHTDSLFRSLTDCEVISQQIRNAKYSIECERKKNQALYNCKKTELRNGYIEFLKNLCCEYGSVRFPNEIISATKEYYERQEALEEHTQRINYDLACLKRLSVTVDGIYDGILNKLTKTTKQLAENIEIAEKDFQIYQVNREKVDKYFSYQNEEIERLYREDIGNGFAILKRIHAFSPFNIKKKKSFKTICRNMTDCYGEIEELKMRITDEYDRSSKNAAYRNIVTSFCKEIAQELFYKDRYQEYISQKACERNFPDLLHYISLQKQLKELIERRRSILDSYNIEYTRYLSSVSIRGSMLFRKEEDLYEDN